LAYRESLQNLHLIKFAVEFASYFTSQNEAIAAGTLVGQIIPIIALGINNGWFDGAITLKQQIEFSANNTYRHVITDEQYTNYIDVYNNQCLPLIENCTTLEGNDAACVTAFNTCYAKIYYPITTGSDFDVYDIREPAADPYPPKTYIDYLHDPAVMTAIGATHTYTETDQVSYGDFISTGDCKWCSRIHFQQKLTCLSIVGRSFLPTLSSVVQTGITTLIYAGDADWICNWFSGLESANSVEFSGSNEFNHKGVRNYTVHGVAQGTFKTAKNLSWLRVFDSGHLVPYYRTL
jgi:carboxypeptidase C (cathepsin A)